MNTWTCDFSADPGHPRVAQLQMQLNVGLKAVDFVCRDNVDGKKAVLNHSVCKFLIVKCFSQMLHDVKKMCRKYNVTLKKLT